LEFRRVLFRSLEGRLDGGGPRGGEELAADLGADRLGRAGAAQPLEQAVGLLQRLHVEGDPETLTHRRGTPAGSAPGARPSTAPRWRRWPPVRRPWSGN